MVQFVGVLDNIRSLHNVGSIFRTADGAGVSKLFLCGITGKPPRAEIRKSALGAEEFVEWEYHSDIHAVLDQLRQQNFQIVALENSASGSDYRKAAYRVPLALVIGNEFHGLSQEVLDGCDLVIRLPMRGRKSSLNVSVAFGIAAYEIAEQIGQPKPSQ